MQYKTSFTVGLMALCATGCATGHSPSHVQTYESGAPIVKLAANDAATEHAGIPARMFDLISEEKSHSNDIEDQPQTHPASHSAEVFDQIETKVKTVSQYSPAPKQTYKRLEYGAHKPLVCKDPVPATGKLKDRPNLQVMWENYLYPKPEGIWGEIGGYVEINGNLPEGQGRWTNACAIRVSHMLLRTGHRIPQRFGITSSAANKDQYIYRLSDMEDYLVEIMGEPGFKILDGSARWWDLPNTPGIVLIDFPGHNSFTGHTTVWNGAGTVDGSDITGDRVLFWELPCFIPEERIEDKSVDEPEILVGELDAPMAALP